MGLYERLIYTLYQPLLRQGRLADNYYRRSGIFRLLLMWHILWGAVVAGLLGRLLVDWGWPALRLAGGWLWLAGAGLSLLGMAWLSPSAERLRQLDQAGRHRTERSRSGELAVVYVLFFVSLALAVGLLVTGQANP